MKREREARNCYNVMPKKGKELEIDEFQNRIAMYTSQNIQPVKLKKKIKKKKEKKKRCFYTSSHSALYH